jgi:hypothetical protein
MSCLFPPPVSEVTRQLEPETVCSRKSFSADNLKFKPGLLKTRLTGFLSGVVANNVCRNICVFSVPFSPDISMFGVSNGETGCCVLHHPRK